MVSIMFEGFSILALLLASFAFQSLSVYGVHHQERRFMEENPVKETQENDASLNKELVAGTLEISSVSSKARIGGRKTGMLFKKEDEEMISRSSKGDHAQKLNVEAAAFVAFTADYHMAKHHPPRNN